MLFISTKKAQTWYIDVIIAIFIFTLCLVFYYRFIPNLESQESEDLIETLMDAKAISKSLMSEGHPFNWTNNTVQRIGILTGRRTLNQTKVSKFKQMADDDYDETRRIFNIKSHYSVYFVNMEEKVIKIGTIEDIGHVDIAVDAFQKIDISAIDYKNLVSITRILIYNMTTTKMVIYTWD